MTFRYSATAFLSVLVTIIIYGCGGGGGSSSASRYRVANLISDQVGNAPIVDPQLVNGWGIALSPAAGNFWISSNRGDVSLVYGGDVNGSAFTNSGLVVTIPDVGVPTGQVFNSSADFVVTSGQDSAPALFIFATLGGTIAGWNPGVPQPAPSTTARTGVTVPGAVYTGLAIGNNGNGNFLYAADFAGGAIHVFSSTYVKTNLAGNFVDPTIPGGYSPYNIQNLGGTLYVAYAKPAAGGVERGAGLGFVSRFDLNGNFLGRLTSQGVLNAPWGVAIAPASFGKFSNALLVGNFGDGKIHAFNPTTGESLGTLSKGFNQPIVIDGLWGIAFGNGVSAGDSNALYFSAGPANETHGLFGKIVVD